MKHNFRALAVVLGVGWLSLSACAPVVASNPDPVATSQAAEATMAVDETPSPAQGENVVGTPVTTSREYVTLTPGPTVEPGALRYYWPSYLPEGFTVSGGQTFADPEGYELSLFAPDQQSQIYGAVLRLQGGLIRRNDGGGTVRFRWTLYDICALSGCVAYDLGHAAGFTSNGTGGGISISWEADGQVYAVGCMCDSARVELDRIVQSLEPVDIETWLVNVAQLPVEQ